MKNNKILLHVCCAICSAHPIKLLQEKGYEVVSYFFNPNIQPESEYLKRLEAQKILCEDLGCELVVEDYRPELFEDVAIGLESEPEKGKRCTKCFELRLNQSAKKAQGLGIDAFTTSIVISPHKNFKLISDLGKTISENHGIKYIEIDFKKQNGFLNSNKIAKDLGLYRQNYCGCLYGKNR